VSSRARVYGIVAACAVAAAGLTVGVTLATRTPTPKRPAGQAGAPPLVLDLGVRTDPEAVALRLLETFEAVAVKLGAAGAVAAAGGQVVRLPAVLEESEGAIGAGDAFDAGLLVGLARGRDLHAALVGNPMRFTRQDAVEEAWRVFQPLLDSPPPVHPYAPGSWGPEECEALVAGHGSWHGPWIAE